jgi:hypothetical protein
MGHLSGVVEDLKKELKRAQLDVQRASAALAALGSSNSKGERTLSASARNEGQLRSRGEMVKNSKGIEASSGENIGLGTREAHLVSISPQQDRHLSKARWAKVKAGKKAAQVQARE